MKTYVIESTRYEGEIRYSYNASGLLVGYQALCDIDDERLALIIQHLPLTRDTLMHMVEIARRQKTLTRFYELVQSCDFDTFWAAYPHKVGKTEARKSWTKLKDSEQNKAVQYIPDYKKQATRDRVAYLYPATYLNQKRWEDQA